MSEADHEPDETTSLLRCPACGASLPSGAAPAAEASADSERLAPARLRSSGAPARGQDGEASVETYGKDTVTQEMIDAAYLLLVGFNREYHDPMDFLPKIYRLMKEAKDGSAPRKHLNPCISNESD